MTRRTMALALAIALTGCIGCSAPDRLAEVTVRPIEDPASKAAVYAALANNDHWGLQPLSKLVVKRMTIPMPTVAASSADWLRQWDEIPEPLRRAAEHAQPTTADALPPSLFPAGTRLVDASEIDAFFSTRTGMEDKWTSFRRQFDAAGWVGFSDVVCTARQTDALVYYEGRCGATYGVGAYVWLHRNSAAGSQWAIRRRVVGWIS